MTLTPGQQRRQVPGSVSARAVAAAPPEGRVVAIWGPTGAPGRTTIAVNLAAELAHAGTPTLLADADVYGGVLAQVLGVLDEAPGLAAAVRLANNGRLDAAELAGLAREVSPHLRVLTGLARADRWMELRPPALEAVLDLARRLAEVTVLDCGFCLERDEVLSFDTAAPQRNGATLAALAAADVVIAVGAADPVGIARLVRGLGELRDVAPAAQLVVVANRVRRGPIGGQPGARLREALASHADVRDVVLVPDDRSALDESLLLGRSLVESAPSSPVRAALAEIATAAGLGPTAPARRASRWRRVRPLTRRNARPVLLR